jgi:hypothetical protein
MEDLRTNKEILHQLENRIDEKLNKIEEKLEKPVMTYGEFGIILGSIFIAFLGCLAWILLT